MSDDNKDSDNKKSKVKSFFGILLIGVITLGVSAGVRGYRNQQQTKDFYEKDVWTTELKQSEVASCVKEAESSLGSAKAAEVCGCVIDKIATTYTPSTASYYNSSNNSEYKNAIDRFSAQCSG